jgi:hypothetical protein
MSSARFRWSRVLPIVALAIASAVVFSTRSGSAAAAPQTNQRSLAVGVLDKSGAPVADLTVDDVIVREDGVAREIVRVSPAPPPTEVVLLVDDSQAAAPLLRDLREALNGFANTMADLTPPPAVRLTTFGDRPTVVVDFNPSFSAISRGIDRITPRPGAGATLLEAIDETAGALERRRAQRPVIVAFVTEAGPEFGTLRHTNIAAALQRANASLWTIVLTQRGGGGSSDAERERDMVLGDVTRQSGGRNAQVLASQNIPAAFATLAAQLASRWEITYGRPETLVPPSKLEIQTRDTTRQVLAPRWAGR